MIGRTWGSLSPEAREALPVGTVVDADGDRCRLLELRADGTWRQPDGWTKGPTDAHWIASLPPSPPAPLTPAELVVGTVVYVVEFVNGGALATRASVIGLPHGGLVHVRDATNACSYEPIARCYRTFPDALSALREMAGGWG